MNKLAFGCSHTYGIGVDPSEAWPALLGAINYGQPGCSSDLIARIMPKLLAKHNPTTVYVLWPDWTRFEYLKAGAYVQSLPTDKDRIYFMEKATNEWLQINFKQQQQIVYDLCKNIKLIDLTLYDLIPYIDNADKWPQANDGMHFNHKWHLWVADIFNEKT
jgi:lysophospholipase L1-like esterase